MKHAVKTRTLSRTRRGRTALLRGLAISLIEHGQIKTTTAKAKELRPFVERLVTYAKKNNLSSKRLAMTALGQPKNEVVGKLFNDIAPKFADRSGGYTRIIKAGRTSAGRDESVIEFVA